MTIGSIKENSWSSRLQSVRQRIDAAARQAGRSPNAVRLLAVSKTFPATDVELARAAGQLAFGENYIQEGVEKIAALQGEAGDIEWHCIGPIQSNKTRLVAEHFDWVQTIDRLKIAQRLNDHRPANLPPLNVCIQVNIDGGATKSGVNPEAADALAEAVLGMPNLRLRGLMCIPDPQPNWQAQCEVFLRARHLYELWLARGWPMDTLSMGMSADLEAAVASGSTMVRVGSALFGQRGVPVETDQPFQA